MIIHFFWGCLAASSGMVGLLFLRFWRDARERHFLYFAIAFWILSLNWFLLGVMPTGREGTPVAYFVLTAAFLVMVIGIMDKKRRT